MLNYALPIILALPILLIPYELTGVSLTDLAALVGLSIFFISQASHIKVYLFSSIAIATLALTWTTLRNNANISLSFFSLIFFFKPCFCYFAGQHYTKTDTNQKHFHKWFGITSFVFLSLFSLDVAVNHEGLLRTESQINGSFLSIPVFGTYGVNSLAVFFAILSFWNTYAYQCNPKRPVRFFLLASSLGYATLTFQTQSREAIIGLASMQSLYFLLNSKNKILSAMLCMSIIGLGAALIEKYSQENENLTAKRNQILKGIENKDLDFLSSGRITLYENAIKIVRDHPILGTAFGSALPRSEIFDNEEQSPHNQYITAAWKMGLPAAFFYILTLYSMAKKAIQDNQGLHRSAALALTLTTFFIFSILWDILMVPTAGGLIFFLLGFLSRSTGPRGTNP